jgi:ABC-type transport system involved in multi-copper enzyme maturation permease subunit
MIGVLKSIPATIVHPSRWTGPIFAKELRVSSRRKRNYLMRTGYVAALTVFVVIVWVSAVGEMNVRGAAASYVMSRMAAAGTAIVSTVLVFQFVATQVLAVIMLSTAISDEIYNKTLGTLMSTPINSFQIVFGKLLSKLLQLVILMLITLPLLAIVRVFGGVPWAYILMSLCVTFTAVIFAGCLSIYFSISVRRAYEVIVKTAFTLAGVYTFLPSLMVLQAARSSNLIAGVISPLIALTNPFAVMEAGTSSVMGGGGWRGGALVLRMWPVHCVVMLIVSAIIMARSVVIVRKAALRQATGAAETVELGLMRRIWRKKKHLSVKPAEGQSVAIRRVSDSPVLWKELRIPFVQGGRKAGMIAIGFTVAALAVTYGVCIRERCLQDSIPHVVYAVVFTAIAMVANIIMAATTITSEKESRCWPLLLGTSMDDREILLGKAIGVLRRFSPILCILFGHVVFFVIIRYIHPVAIIHLAMVLGWMAVFLTGMGIYFSSLFKRSTSAVVATVAAVGLLWVIVPITLASAAPSMGSDEPFLMYISTNPIVQAGVVMAGAAGQSNAHVHPRYFNYPWPAEQILRSTGRTTTMILVSTGVYVSCGLILAWRAKCRFRRKVF